MKSATPEDMIEEIRFILWLDTDYEKNDKLFMNPDKEWDTETVERIARVLTENGHGPVLKKKKKRKKKVKT